MPRWQEAHYRLMGWWIDGPWGVATAGLGLRVQIERPALPETPLVVLARHAGMGDSLVLVRTLLELGRRPRLVIQAALEWDPCIDLIGHRVPTVFVPVQRERRQRAVPSVERLALDMHDNDALVIFPEGGNSTRRRREAVVRRMHARGRHRLADRAASLRHLLPPQPTGTLAILRAAPEATVVVAAHAGLDQVEDVTSLIDNVPLRAPVRLAWRLVRPDELPDSDASREEWLMDQWQDMDATITALDAGADARTTPLLRQRADEVG